VLVTEPGSVFVGVEEGGDGVGAPDGGAGRHFGRSCTANNRQSFQYDLTMCSARHTPHAAIIQKSERSPYESCTDVSLLQQASVTLANLPIECVQLQDHERFLPRRASAWSD
jgi:hypothetical protein